MPFPDHIARILDEYGLPADTKAALYDLYVSMGDEVLEVFSELAERVPSVAQLQPDDTLEVKPRLVERFLRRNHPAWLQGMPTASFWYPRALEGRASGAAMPLRRIEGEFADAARHVIGDAQPLPDGVLILGKNAHYGGRQETISFDIVPENVEEAIAIGLALGQQHTLPGSVGETSATFDAATRMALIWEVQPNVYKPAGDRNRAIAKVFRRHRNWHLVTLTAALQWLRSKNVEVFILRGNALATTHEVNPNKPVSTAIAAMHDRTVQQVVERLGAQLIEITIDDETRLLESILMNFALRRHAATSGVTEMIWRVEWGASNE